MMDTTELIRAALVRLRAKAQAGGPQHSAWDDIADVEALLAGERTLAQYPEGEAGLHVALARLLAYLPMSQWRPTCPPTPNPST